MVTDNTQRKALTRLQITIDQQMFIQALWADLQQANNIQNNRQRENIRWRHAFMSAVSEQTVLSLKSIGGIMNKDHATVLHARAQHEGNMLYDERYKHIYEMISAELEETLADYQDQVYEVIRDKKIPVNGDKTAQSMVDLYEQRIKALRNNMEREILELKHKNSILTRELKRAQTRAQGLNEECKRLKNLL